MGAERFAGLGEARAAVDPEAPARKRLTMLFDGGRYSEIGGAGENGTAKSVVAAYGMVEGAPVYAFSQDVTQCGGAVGRLQAQKICRVLELAAKTGAPVVGIYDSNGAKADEGAEVLAAYSEILRGVASASGVVPQIAVVAGVCAGGMALAASGADVVIMSEDGQLFMTAPFVAGDHEAATAGCAADSGIAHIVAPDGEIMERAREVLSILPSNNIAGLPAFEFEAPAQISVESAYGAAESVVDAGSVIELFGHFGAGVRCGFATVGGSPVGFASVDGTLTADGCSKLTRHIGLCDSYSIPFITFIDTDGFDESVSGLVREGARLAYAYACATTVKLAVVTGRAYGAAYSVLAGRASSSDMTFVWDRASVGALAPATAVELMYADKLSAEYSRADAERDYASNEAGAVAAAENGIADSVIFPEETRAAVLDALGVLEGKRTVSLPRKHENRPL